MRLPPSIVARAGAWTLRLLERTLRWEIGDPAALRARATPGGAPCIVAFWHNRLLLVPLFWQRHFKELPRGYAMTSLSGDGELLAQFIGQFGFGSVRGSATRRGSGALREMTALLKKGHIVALTPDGSRGPLYEIKPGLVLLAQLSGRPILPLSFEFSRCWRLKSWDRFMIPKPFSRVRLVIGDLHCVRRTHSPEEFEAERQRCEAALLAVVRER